MATLEAEAMLLGVWENVQHLEEVLSLAELHKVLEAGRDRDMRNWKFQASLKGINLDDEQEEEQETGEEVMARLKRRAALKASGITDEAELNRKIDQMEIFDMGLEFEEG